MAIEVVFHLAIANNATFLWRQVRHSECQIKISQRSIRIEKVVSKKQKRCANNDLLDSFSLGWKARVEKMEMGKMSGMNVNMHQKPLARVEKMEINASKSIVALLFDLVS
jgi:hypothetical protein